MKQFQNILYVADASVAPGSAMARAVSLAKVNQAALTVVDVVPPVGRAAGASPGGPDAGQLQAAIVGARQKALEDFVAPYRPLMNIRIEVLVGTPFLEVIRAVLRNGYDLVLKSAENPDWIARLFGSDDMHLLRKCPCPVWLMKPQENPNYRCILAAVDFNPNDPYPDPQETTLNRQILGFAGSLAVSDFAELHLVHAWDAPEAGFVRLWADNPDAAEMSMIEGERDRHRSGMDAIAQMLRQEIGADAFDYLFPRIHLPQGPARKAIPALVNELKADLVVMGTVSRTGISGFIIGNTAEAILDQMQCSVLAIKPPSFVSPVKQH